MINLTTRITLIKPGVKTQRGDGTLLEGAKTKYQVFARKREYQGSESLVQSTEIAQKRTEFTIRRSGFEDLNTQWLIEQNNKTFRIESVIEATFAPRLFLIINASLRE